MLTFSKDRQPDLAPGQPAELISDVVELMQARARETGVALEARLPDHLPELMFDAELMHRALLNVVTNAIDACEKCERGRVDVSVELDQAQGLWSIVVADNGEGIPESERNMVFAVFESRKGSRGTGLGLPVSQKILREHGGQIRVESQVGVGSTFILELPAVLPEAAEGTGSSVQQTA
jgi:signal transduction histidine kinase